GQTRRTAARNAQARENIWQRARDAQVEKALQAGRTVDGEQDAVPLVHAAQTDGGIRDDGKERDDGGTDDQRALGVLHQNDDERRDRDDRRYLQNDGVGKEAALDDRALHE